ncbi:MAG TPA: DsbA family protein [Solirubrobacteraceae bacterium]|nr:DsbA family protein [Solirubrobacteraceae bacterium]
MGVIIFLSERMADRSRPTSDRARFFFALDCPLSYLMAERVERALGEIEWVPVLGPLSEPDGLATCADRVSRAQDSLRLAEHEAQILQLPLVEPHPFPLDSRKASRAAAFAADAGAGAGFALAVARLAFCGGFDIARDNVIEEAAAVAGLDPAAAVAAARNARYDQRLDATSRGLHARGIVSPPAISIGTSWFEGPDAVISAVSFSAARARLGAPGTPAN